VLLLQKESMHVIVFLVRKETRDLTGSQEQRRIVHHHSAGTERVFIDGQLTQRGSDRDYVIDYNSGEVTFTPTRLITKDKRIEVEFQYSDKAFLRTIFYANQELHSDKGIFASTSTMNRMQRISRCQQALNDTQKFYFYKASGDSLNKAFYPSIDSVAVHNRAPLYKKIDSPGFIVYVYSTNPDSAALCCKFFLCRERTWKLCDCK